jgi:hypothetical protein
VDDLYEASDQEQPAEENLRRDRHQQRKRDGDDAEHDQENTEDQEPGSVFGNSLHRGR